MHLFYTTEKISSGEFLSRAFALAYPERKMPSVCKEADGKPYFKNTDDIFFSITHDGNVTAVTFSSRPIGIDYCQKMPRNLEGFMRRLGTEEEIRRVLDAKDPRAAFFSFWSAKESFVKLTGEGLKGIRNCSVSESLVKGANVSAHLLQIPLSDGILSLCSSEKKELTQCILLPKEW